MPVYIDSNGDNNDRSGNNNYHLGLGFLQYSFTQNYFFRFGCLMATGMITSLLIACNDTYSSKTLLLYPEDGDVKFLRRVRNLLPDYKATHPKDILNLTNVINIIPNLHVKYHLNLSCIIFATYVHKR
jgi:hypothetical protein